MLILAAGGSSPFLSSVPPPHTHTKCSKQLQDWYNGASLLSHCPNFFRNCNFVTISGSLMWWCETEMWGRDEGFWLKWGEDLYISSPDGRITQYVGVSFITCSKYLNSDIWIGCLGILIISFTMRWRLVYFIAWWANHTNMSFLQVLESDILSARILFEA